MAHQVWKSGTMIYPVPAAIISCGNTPDEYNLITISWLGTICTNPAMCYISVRPERHSYGIIERNRAFVINLTTEKIAKATDWCGVKSGRDFDKFKESGLTAIKSPRVAAPYIEESPLCIECRVKDIIKLGSHDMFIAEVVNLLADDSYIDSKSGKFELEKSGIIAYSHGQYFNLGEPIGRFGWSVAKDKRKSKSKKT